MSTPINVTDRGEKIAKAQSLLSDAVANLQSNEGWKSMLDGLARGGRNSIRRFSFRNQILIAMQRPTASAVATYRSWLRQGRQVRRGEKSVVILAPIIVSKRTNDDMQETESKLVGFRTLPVFAAEQTDRMPGAQGKPLPEPAQLTKDIIADECFDSSVETLRSVALGLGPDVVTGIDIRPRQDGDHPSAHGWYVPSSRRIVVVSGETARAHQFKTLVHELAHAILHGASDHHARDIEEIEAESTAYVVCSIMNIECSGYSAPYVASWAGTKDAQAMILASGQRIVKAVNVILDALVGPVTNLEQEREAA